MRRRPSDGKTAPGGPPQPRDWSESCGGTRGDRARTAAWRARRRLLRAAQTPQAEPSPGTDHGMEPAVVLDVFDETRSPIASRSSAGFGKLGASAKSPSAPRLRWRIAASIRRCLSTSGLTSSASSEARSRRATVSRRSRASKQPLVGRRVARESAMHCNAATRFRPAQYFHRASRVECEVQAEVGELRNRRGGFALRNSVAPASPRWSSAP